MVFLQTSYNPGPGGAFPAFLVTAIAFPRKNPE
jgi:hypothetical protein